MNPRPQTRPFLTDKLLVRMSFSLRRLCACSVVAAALAGGLLDGCEKASDRPEDTLAAPPGGGDTASPSAVPATRTTNINLGNAAEDLRKRAEGGDVQSMIVLGRFYE